MPCIFTPFISGHILILHHVRSNNPLGIYSRDYVQFTPYFTVKDLFGGVIF